MPETVSLEKILKNLKTQVSNIRRMSIRKSRQIIDTHTYVITFSTPNLPFRWKIGFMMVTVKKYIPNPLILQLVKKGKVEQSRERSSTLLYTSM